MDRRRAELAVWRTTRLTETGFLPWGKAKPRRSPEILRATIAGGRCCARTSDRPPSTVLVVEDEALVRMYAAGLLEDAGYQVIDAPDAQAALRIMESNPGIRVLFTDIEMPGAQNGLDLARRVNDRWPHVLLLIASGGVKPTEAEIPDSGRFVAKPYSAEIVDHVDGLIDSASETKAP